MTATTPKVWTVGKAITAALNEDGEDQQDLAARIGKTPSWVSRRISGSVKITVADLRLIADAQSRDWNWYGYPYGRPENLEDGFIMGLYRNRSKALYNRPVPLAPRVA